MRLRIQPGLLALIVVALCLGAVAAFYFYRAHRIATPEQMIGSLPPRDATLVYINVGALRSAGLLDLIAGSKATEELEYKNFVDESGFDYRRDLDALAASFAPDGTYAVVRGRFDWRRLIAYSANHGGKCRNGLCQVVGSTPNRAISYYPLKSDTMALAFSSDPFAAASITVHQQGPGIQPLPPQPIWISVPTSVLKAGTDLPSGTKSFASALATAESVVFSIGPEHDRFQALVNVTCATPDAASELVLKLQNVTDLLRKMVAREHQTPNPRDLSGVLTSGTFRREGRMVFGHWPLERSFVDAVAGGSLN